MLKTIDEVRRECIRIGTALEKDDKSGAREAIAKSQVLADENPAVCKTPVEALAKMLDKQFSVKDNGPGRQPTVTYAG